MAEKVAKKIEQIIKDRGNKEFKKFAKLEQVNEMYKEMVAKGLIKPKGYGLRSPLDPMTEEERKNFLRLKDAYSFRIQNQR